MGVVFVFLCLAMLVQLRLLTDEDTQTQTDTQTHGHSIHRAEHIARAVKTVSIKLKQYKVIMCSSCILYEVAWWMFNLPSSTDRKLEFPSLEVLLTAFWPLALTSNPRRFMVMIHTHTKGQLLKSIGSKDRVETKGRADGRTDVQKDGELIALLSSVTP